MQNRRVAVWGTEFLIAGFPSDPYFEHLGEGRDNAILDKVTRGLPDNAVIFDVGANIGATTALMAKRLPNAAIYSFEPSPLMFGCLNETVRLNGFPNCHPIQKALGDEPGAAPFFFHESAPGAAHLATSHSLRHGNETVTVSTLDTEIKSHSLSRLDLIKIDVEGFESNVLDGAKDAIARFHPTVVLEFNSFTMIAFRNLNPRTFLARLMEEFPFVYRMLDSGELSRIESRFDQMRTIRDNIVHHGSVDDLLCCWANYPAPDDRPNRAS